MLLQIIAKQLEINNELMKQLIHKVPDEPNEDKLISAIITFIQVQKEMEQGVDPIEALQQFTNNLRKQMPSKKNGGNGKGNPNGIFMNMKKKSQGGY